jgi:hypothetical protein
LGETVVILGTGASQHDFPGLPLLVSLIDTGMERR